MGKKVPLTDDQIVKLESIGFAWSTGGTGRYNRDSESEPNESSGASAYATGAVANGRVMMRI